MRIRIGWLITFLAIAIGTAILVGLGKLSGALGWSGVLLATVAALASMLFGPISEWFKRMATIKADRQVQLLASLRTGKVLRLNPRRANPVMDMRVHPPIQLPTATALPPYVARSIDSDLDIAIRCGGLVIIEGSSASGKTRALFEALIRNSRRLWKEVIVPRDGAALRELAESDFNFRAKAIWLDDLERFISPSGLDESLIRAIHTRTEGQVLFAATLRSQEVGKLTARMLSTAKRLYLERCLNSAEEASARALRSDPRIAFALEAAADGVGLAEYLAAGPAAVDHWQSGRHGANELGAAFVSASIDFRRAGYLDPIPLEWLKAVAPAYLRQRKWRQPNGEDLNSALKWATHKVHGASSCLVEVVEGRFVPFDYLIDHVQRAFDSAEPDNARKLLRQSLREIPDQVWHHLSDNLPFDDPQYLSCLAAGDVAGHIAMMHRLLNAVDDGVVDLDYFNNGERQLYLAITSMRLGRCPACMIAVMKLDITPLIGAIADRLAPSCEEDSSELAIRETDAVALADFLGARDNFVNELEKLMGTGLSIVSPERLRHVGGLLYRENRLKSARSWLRVAADRGDIEAIGLMETFPSNA